MVASGPTPLIRPLAPTWLASQVMIARIEAQFLVSHVVSPENIQYWYESVTCAIV